MSEVVNKDPSAAEFAGWWLSGQLFAEPADLLRDLLKDYIDLEVRLAAAERDNARLIAEAQA